MLYLKRGEGRPSPLSTIQKGEKMGKKAKQNEAGYDNNGNKVEAKTSVLLCVFVLAVVVLAGILLILLADCYGWFTFLEKPLNAAGQFLKRKLDEHMDRAYICSTSALLSFSRNRRRSFRQEASS